MQALYENYVAVLLAGGTGVMLVITAIIGARVLAPFANSREKGTAYECGMLPIGRVRTQIHVRYYVYAILFLIFDVEAAFLYPWAVIYRELGLYGFVEMVVFVLILGVGLVYAWKKGALKWV